MRLDPERFSAVVAGIIKSAISGLAERIKVLEDRGIVHGKDGAPGPQGERGDTGEPGKDGKDGQDGFPGIDGKPGERGPAGPAGEPGENGRDGRDGLPGVPGQPGEKGLDGAHGRDGVDGKDGPAGRDGTLENLKIEYDGSRTVKFCLKDGTPIEGGEIRFPIVLDRGVYKAGEVYEQGDGVSWGGDYYIALKDTRATPGTEKDGSGRSWRLAVRRGSEGKQGKAGPEGPQGKQGPMGPQGQRGF